MKEAHISRRYQINFYLCCVDPDDIHTPTHENSSAPLYFPLRNLRMETNQLQLPDTPLGGRGGVEGGGLVWVWMYSGTTHLCA